MHIGVDYTAAAWQGAGIGRYTRELMRAVVGLDPQVRYTFFYAARGLPPTAPYVAELRALCAAHANVRARPLPISPRQLTILWQRLRLPLYAEWLAGAFDLLHAPDFVLPPTRARTILTVHDLTFMVHPECADAGLRRYLARAVPRSLHRADLVLVDSQATAADLARLLGVQGPKVRLLYPGVDARFRPLPASATEPLRASLGLPANFLLFVGTLEPRKNLVRLLEGFAQAKLPPDLALVIAGRRGWMEQAIFATVARLQLQDRVKFLDFVADAQLPALYNLAQAFVYPSLYEGFGLPVLEALACGTPVLTANSASLPEVAGAAAIFVDPHDPLAIAGGIEQTLREAERLRTIGPEQARRFCWTQAAERLLACYTEVLGA
ncbi:glycosyltransferase family 4 protein [Candidatus Viridilinea mediisalina]|uniref:Glycosyl transferase family 1 n=1 Tax=Candidatus Viridilinea mediisalina TaxID=2024553 RepID=A0A2A6RJ66_9CHLR|nr:glycosyltransferase family 1 protein [Candidatus Viridilinea mediisalina]PDW02929.1 glycosyl transferase family 1 [Candidatus Viridilinea mediisalina]